MVERMTGSSVAIRHVAKSQPPRRRAPVIVSWPRSFLVGAFFFAGDFLAGGAVLAAGAFFAGAFLAGAFFAGAFLAGAFCAGAFLAGAFFFGLLIEESCHHSLRGGSDGPACYRRKTWGLYDVWV